MDIPLSKFERDESSKVVKEDERSLFSWHVKAACDAAGLTNVQYNTTLLNVFDGEICVDMDAERRNRRANMIFVCAALDTLTGNVITQTRFDDDSMLLSPQEYKRQNKRYAELSLGGDHLCVVSHDTLP